LIINTDKAASYGVAIATLKREGRCPAELVHRQTKYLNNVIEADHGKRKRLIKPTSGFPSLKTAYATLKGFEVMRALKKRQTRAFQIQDGFWVRYAWLSGRSVAGPMPWLKPLNTSGPCSIPLRLHLPENGRPLPCVPFSKFFATAPLL